MAAFAKSQWPESAAAGALNLPCRLSSIVNRPSGYSRRQEFPATDEARPMSKPIALSDTQMVQSFAWPDRCPRRTVMCICAKWLQRSMAARKSAMVLWRGSAPRCSAVCGIRRLMNSRRAAKHRARPARANASPRSQGRARMPKPWQPLKVLIAAEWHWHLGCDAPALA
jgi:hypothetical protein